MNTPSPIRYVDAPISTELIKQLAVELFGDMVKAVVDVERKVMAIGGELHADEEAYLLEKGSVQANLWGINIYPGQPLPQAIEFDSMINVRPSQGNRSRGVEDEALRAKITKVVESLITP
ncbi:MAG: DUF5674 family protein [Candidatus Veblenbacteria bacterium]|nr:DUF5674 family protein [Candidatus Veblenbacteria bacterium]